MGATYNYQTGKMTRDFKFVKKDNVCRLSSLPVRVGSDWCKEYCNHYRGVFGNFSKGFCVMCQHPDAKDSDGCEEIIRLFYEKLKLEALCALCQ